MNQFLVTKVDGSAVTECQTLIELRVGFFITSMPFLLAAGSGHNETTSQSVPMATTRKFCRGRERSETGRR
jgi:hypothetical protein